jgi:hypothetical protein
MTGLAHSYSHVGRADDALKTDEKVLAHLRRIYATNNPRLGKHAASDLFVNAAANGNSMGRLLTRVTSQAMQ